MKIIEEAKAPSWYQPRIILAMVDRVAEGGTVMDICAKRGLSHVSYYRCVQFKAPSVLTYIKILEGLTKPVI